MSRERVDGDGESVTEDSIVLAMPPGRNRELLVEWLGSFPRYRVETVSAPEDLPDSYDLCLVGGCVFERFYPVLRSRAQDASSVFLPHVLTVLERDSATPRTDLSVETDRFLADVVSFPVDQSLLRRRLENLLQARRASVRLAEQEQQYRRLVELTPEPIVLVDGTDVVYANASAGNLFETETATALTGRSLLSLVATDDHSRLRGLLQQTRDETDGERDFVELGMQSTSGRELLVAIAGVPVVFGGNSVVQLVVRDLTEKREREQRLTLFGRAMEVAAQGITIADAGQDDLPLIYANEGFERITGYPVEKVLGRNCRFLQGEHTDPETVDDIRQALDEDRPISTDILNYRRDGTPFWNRLDIVPVNDEHGRVTHFLGLQRDVTEQREREQQLAVLNRVLRHNLRNKLNVVRVYASRLQERDETSEEAAAILEATEELLTVSEQVRTFDSILAADERDLESLDLASVLRNGVAAIRDRNPDANISASIPEHAAIRAHETLEPALTDLVTMTEGFDDSDIDISIDVTVTDGDVRLAVTDYGGSVREQDLEVVASGIETQLQHLQNLELWLIRWAVVESHGEFTVDTDGEAPVIQMRFLRADSTDLDD